MPYFQNQRGSSIYYEVFNAEKNHIPLVLVHGYGSSFSMFGKQIPILKEHFKLILFDAQGHGKSDKLDDEFNDKLLDHTIQDLELLLDLLELHDHLGILGHSIFGCDVAQTYTEKHPDRVDFQILLNGGTLILDSTIRNIFWNLLPQYTRMHFHEVVQTSFQTLLKKTIPFIQGALLEDNLSEAEIESFTFQIEEELNDLIDIEISPRKVSCPTLIIGAELDNFAPAYMSKQLRKAIPSSELYIVNMTGHFGLVQHYTEYNSLILDFLKKHKLISE